jgi:nickel-dependent lactate racemase
METEIHYGTDRIKVIIPDDSIILNTNNISIKNENNLLKNSFKKQINSIGIDEFIKGSKKLLIIVNDATRPTPTSKILEFIYHKFSNHNNFKILVATGSHRLPNEEEKRYIFGYLYDYLKGNIFFNDAKNENQYDYFGKTKNGTEVFFNKIINEYKNIIVIGSVEPHYFAGYTGGRKAFLPGIASYRTIEMNHKFALNENAQTFKLKGNPVHEDMIEAVKLIKNINIFSIQCVLTTDNKIYAITTGDLNQSFNAAIKYTNEIYNVKLKNKANIVLTIAQYPMDIDLYQSQKAIENGKLAMEEGGVIILISKCRCGIGEDAFFKLLCRAKSPKKIFDILSREYKLGYHKAAKIAQIGLKSEIWVVSDIDDNTIKKTMLKPYSNIQNAIDDAVKLIKSKGKKPKMVVIPSGSLTVPLI